MFCKNCGQQIDDLAAVCVHCGVATNMGINFCKHCGQKTIPGAAVCTNCGISLGTQPVVPVGVEQKSKLVAGLLAILIGTLGIHNFYLGYTKRAVIQLLVSVLTCGFGAPVIWVWAIIEGIQILSGSVTTDANGVPLKE